MKIMKLREIIRDIGKKSLVLFTIMSFMMLLVGDVSYSLPDDNEKLPWWHAKDKVMDATVQGKANNTAIERKNAVEEDIKSQVERKEVKPDLKKKTSGRVASEAARGSGENLLEFVEAPDIIPPPIFEYMNSQDASPENYRLILIDGQYLLAWQGKEEDGRLCIFINTFDKEGNVLTGGYRLTEGNSLSDEMIIGLYDLSEGGKLLVWREGNKANDTYRYLAQKLDDTGEKIGQSYLLADNIEGSFNLAYSPLELEGGKRLFVIQGKYTNGLSTLKVQLIDEFGEKIGDSYELTGNRNVEYAGSVTVYKLSDGNYRITWSESEKVGYFPSVWAQTVSGKTGEKIGDSYCFTKNRKLHNAWFPNNGQYRNQIIESPDGKYTTFIWYEISSKYKSSTWISTLDQEGNEIEYRCLSKNKGDPSYQKMRIFKNSDETHTLIWYSGKDGYIWTEKIGTDGKLVGNGNLVASAKGKGLYLSYMYDIEELPNGQKRLFWRSRNLSTNTHYLFTQTIGESGEKIGKTTLVADMGNQYIGEAQVVKLLDGKYRIFWHQGIQSLWTQALDENGNKIGDADCLTEGKESVKHTSSATVIELVGGSQKIFWVETDEHDNQLLQTQVFTKEGIKGVERESLTSGKSISIYDVYEYENSHILIVGEMYPQGGSCLKAYVFDNTGTVDEEYEILTTENLDSSYYLFSATENEDKTRTLIVTEHTGDFKFILWKQKIAENGEKIGTPEILTRSEGPIYDFVQSTRSPDGSRVVFSWIEENPSEENEYVFKRNQWIQIVDQDWNGLGDKHLIGEETEFYYVGIDRVEFRPDGSIGIGWSGEELVDFETGMFEKTQDYYWVDNQGNEIPWQPSHYEERPGITEPVQTSITELPLPRPERPYENLYKPNTETSKTSPRGNLPQNLSPSLRPSLLSREEALTGNLGQNALRVDLGRTALQELNFRDMLFNSLVSPEAPFSIRLINILQNQNIDSVLVLKNTLDSPTEEEKEILDAAQKLQKDLEEENLAEPGLNQASDDFIRVVANVLLAQALPDLLTEEGMRDIRTLFDEFNKEKNELLELYRESIKPYYENIKEELIKNRAILEIKDILSPDMNDNDITKLGRKAVDSIITKLKAEDTKTQKEKALLKKEAELRGQYLNPALVRLEENMRFLLESYTHKLTLILEGTGLVENPKKS